MEFDVSLTPSAAIALKYAVDEALKNWPGAPARPAEEQEHLWELRRALTAISLEIMFHQHSEGDNSK